MGNRYKFLLMFLFVFSLTMIVAQPVYEQNTDVTLSVPCTINGAVCGGSATCVGTVLDPDDIVLYNEESMTQDGAVFELNITDDDTAKNGEYRFSISCSQGGRSSYKNLVFHVSPNGELVTTGKGILYGGLIFILVILFILSLYGGHSSEGIVGKSAFWLVAYLLLIGITFVGWNLGMDYLTSAPFIASFLRIIFLVLLWALLPVILFLTFYTMWMMKNIDAIQNMIDKGMPVDEAYERNVKGGLAGNKRW